jgi:crotonobetainyl-CoA:carnitine CoA-transferase CaiB-like acyl-CoA transferase
MLTGVKIIDFTRYLPGPFASMRLAELGAEVMKIEPLEGDPARHTAIPKELVFKANNRHKQSVTLNIKKEEGREIALRLIEKADVVLESFRPGVMEKLGLDYETVKKVKPDLVYCSITGFGSEGERSSQGSHDLNYMAASGILAQLKDERGKPVHPSITLADYMGGLAANEKILGGLLFKQRTGKGSYHCISIADVMTDMMDTHRLIEEETGYPHGISLLNGSIVSYAVYETKDGRYVALAALEKKFWRNFCAAAEKEEWITEHVTPTSNQAVFSDIQRLFKSRTLEEWNEFGQRVDCCLTPVLETNELNREKNGALPSSGGTSLLSAPKKGEHTRLVLNEWLGITEEDWKRLKQKEII